MKFALFALLSATAAAAAEGTILDKIVEEKRNVVFNSRRLSGECLPICVEEPQVLETSPPTKAPTSSPTKNPTGAPTGAPTKNPTASPTKNPTASPTKNPTASPTKNPTLAPTEPVPEVLDCPVAETVQKCVYDTDCLIQAEGLNAQLLNCPSCVSGYCQSKPEVSGNLNCCKRTPGNDLVITNGCGANNICIGFHDHDQCEVNQHSAYCNPVCPNGNIGEFVNGAWEFYDDPDFSRCETPPGRTIDNDQGSKTTPRIYPLAYCLDNEHVKWKPRKKAEMDGEFTSNVLFSVSGGATPTTRAPEVEVLGSECNPPKEPECVYDIDCVDHPDHDPMWCPSCHEGVCIDNSAGTKKGNTNCCKRTPGNDLVITNGCGANNICWGFNQEDQCEVNQHAAYCNALCPLGNVNPDGSVNDDCDPYLDNNQGSKGESTKGLPKIYPMEYCACRHVKWKTNTQFDEIMDVCPGNYGENMVYVEVPEVTSDPDPTPTSFCPSGKLSIECGKDVLTCGMGDNASYCPLQSTTGNGNVINIDSWTPYITNVDTLCEEIIAMLQADFDENGFGVSGEAVKCNQYTQGNTVKNEEVATFACYDDAGAGSLWRWEEGETLAASEAC